MISLNDDEHSIACRAAIVHLKPLEYAFSDSSPCLKAGASSFNGSYQS